MTEKDLLMEAEKVIANRIKKIKAAGGDYNIFSVLRIERNEVFTHSNMIYSLLNPDGSHLMGKTYLKLFVEHVLGFNDPDEKWHAVREWPFSDGRIDFVVFSDNYYAVIEMKIDANDQEAQLSRYEKYAKSKNSNYDVFYLTIDGRGSTDPSSSGLGYHRISFRQHILEWLNLCIDITRKNKKAYTTYTALIQYRNLVKKLISDQKGVEEMSKILHSAAHYRAYLELKNSEQAMKEEFLKKFFSRLEERLKRDVNPRFQTDPKGDDTININESYLFLNKSRSRIGFRLETGKTISMKNGEQYNLIFSIDIGEDAGNIAVGFGLSGIQDGKPVKVKDVITDDDKITIEEIVDIDKYNGKEIFEGWWIYWAYIYSENQINYNLKLFNDPVIEMLDDHNFELEMDRIIGTINSHLGRIK